MLQRSSHNYFIINSGAKTICFYIRNILQFIHVAGLDFFLQMEFLQFIDVAELEMHVYISCASQIRTSSYKSKIK